MSIVKSSRLIFVLLVPLLFLSLSASAPDDMAERILSAERSNEPIPLVSGASPDVTVNGAYEIRNLYVAKRLQADAIAGFKAGLTSEGARKKFGVDSPVDGVLFRSGRRTGSPLIDGSRPRRLMIETEIGFLVGEPITERLPDIQALRRHITAVMPVVELPETGFADPGGLRAVDIIAANVGSYEFITGPNSGAGGIEPDGVTLVLRMNGEAVNSGKGSDVSGGQWESLLNLVNSVLDHGWKIERGNILITGALGEILPALPGSYTADYGGLGKIEFEIK